MPAIVQRQSHRDIEHSAGNHPFPIGEGLNGNALDFFGGALRCSRTGFRRYGPATRLEPQKGRDPTGRSIWMRRPTRKPEWRSVSSARHEGFAGGWHGRIRRWNSSNTLYLGHRMDTPASLGVFPISLPRLLSGNEGDD